MPKRQIVCCVKDEAVSLLEWIAHHRIIGFDEIVFFSNDCTDSTVDILNSAAEQGLCKHFENIVPEGQFPQQSAYHLYDQLDLRRGAEIVMVLDIDEFLNIHVGDGNLSDLLSRVGSEVDLLCLNWLNFGAGDHETWAPENVTSRFLWAKDPDDRSNRDTKSIVLKPEAFGRLSNHHPEKLIEGRRLNVLNASGKEIDVPEAHYQKLWKSLRQLDQELVSHGYAQINHYATKTLDDYCLRQIRGRGWGDDDRHTLKRFLKLNRDLKPERSILKYQTRLEAELASILSLGDLACLLQKARNDYKDTLMKLGAEYIDG